MPNLKEQNLQVRVDKKTHRFHASRGPLGTNTISKTILLYTGSIGRQKYTVHTPYTSLEVCI